MATSMESLWGKLPTRKGETRTPEQILRMQAQILSEATDQLLVGQVNVLGERITVDLRFYVAAPSLYGARVPVAYVQHRASSYPCWLLDPLDSLSIKKVEKARWEGLTTHEGWIECPDEAAFLSALSRILGSAKVHS
ncbi:MAG: hypothetical protein ACREDR_37775, partial [Blastocatellia bacterium]